MWASGGNMEVGEQQSDDDIQTHSGFGQAEPPKSTGILSASSSSELLNTFWVRLSSSEFLYTVLAYYLSRRFILNTHIAPAYNMPRKAASYGSFVEAT